MPSKEEIIKALRCAGSGKHTQCKEDCTYREYNEIPECWKFLADFEKDGKYYSIDCNGDKILLDAVDMLEGEHESFSSL